MRKIASIAAALFLVLTFPYVPSIQNSKVYAKDNSTLNIVASPSVLTAGVVSELVDSSGPFTLRVTDLSGNPVDLTNGGAIEAKIAWNNLFKDDYPEVLPQYYWLRTDLHNDDGTDKCNLKLFNIQPIEIDFSRAREGVYAFKNFVANDVGEFKIQVFTPDRKEYGIATIKVRAPEIDYAIYNTEDPDKKVFHTPGDPDFVMTAADNRIYGITTTVKTAEGKLIKGIASNTQTCDKKTDARLTVSSMMCANFYHNKPTVVVAQDPITGKNIDYISNWGDRYYIIMAVDYNNNGIPEESNREIYDIAGFNVFNYANGNWQSTNYFTFYNTTCTMFDDLTFMTGHLYDYTYQTSGWGTGCIYNSPYAGCYLFPDLNDDKKLDYRDSLKIDDKGQSSFFIFATDVTGITALVGVSGFGEADYAGRGPSNDKDPQDIRKRYKPDGSYKLDFDAFVGYNTNSGRSITSQIVTKVNMNPEKPEVGQPVRAEVTVTTKKDNRPIDRARVQLTGGGVLVTEYTNDQGVATFDFVPQKSGTMTFSVAAGNFGNAISDIQVKKDETPPELTIDDIPLITKNANVKITGKTEPGAVVKVNSKMANVAADGKFFADIELGEGDNAIYIVATDKSDNSIRKTITMTLDSVPPEINLSPIDPKIIEAKTLTISGSTSEPAEVMLLGKTIKTSGQFKFDFEVTYGPNEYAITATDLAGNQATMKFSFTNFRKTFISMKVGSNVMLVNNEPITMKAPPIIENGNTMVPLRAVSEGLGATVNYDAKSKSIEIILGNTQIIMQIGVKMMIVNGEKKTMKVEPSIKNGFTYVPFRAIAEAFNCTVNWASETKEITIERLWY